VQGQFHLIPTEASIPLILIRAICIPWLNCAGDLRKIFCFSKGHHLSGKLMVEEVFPKVPNYFPGNTKKNPSKGGASIGWGGSPGQEGFLKGVGSLG
jgi:hypothetical protein